MARRNICWPCNFMCCFCISYNTIFIFVFSSFIFYFIFLPQELKFTITDASLMRFDYNSTANNTLFYNMALNITIRNPNKKVGVFYNRIQVLPQYEKKRFAMLTLTNSTPFYQGHKNTTIVDAIIQGQQVILFKKKEVDKYIVETNVGIYSIEVLLALRVNARYGKFKSGYYKPQKISCKLKLPLLNNTINGTASNASGFMFKPTTCGNVYVITSEDTGD